MLKRIIGLMLLFLSQPLFAQNLIEIYQLALTQDTQLKISESRFQSTQQALPLAKADRYPQISLSANITGIDSDNDVNDGNSRGFSITLLQNLYNAQTIAAIDVAEAKVAQMQAELEASRQNLIIRVAQHYFDILAADDNVKFAIAEKNAIARQLEQAQKRFEVGLMAITDVREAQALFDSAVAQQLLAENRLENAYQALQVMIAQPPSRALARLGDQLELNIPAPVDSTKWVELALQNNRSLVSSLAALNIARHTRTQQSQGHYPTVDFNARYNNTDSNSHQQDTTLSIELNMPLYTGGRLDAAKQQAEFDYQAARQATILQQRLISQQTRNAYLGVVSGISQVKALNQALNSSTTAFDATEAGFEVGTRTSVDVLVSLRETYRAQRDYASARYDYLLNILQLKQAAGLLNIKDLAQINQALTQ